MQHVLPVSPATRRAFAQRLEPAPVRDVGLLRALVPLVEAIVPSVVPSAGDLARRLAHDLESGAGDGWRHAALPPDLEAWHEGLRRLEEHVANSEHTSFNELSPAARVATLEKLASLAEPFPWRQWLEEVRGRITVLYVSDPRVLERMGFDGFTDGGFAPSELGDVP